MHSGRLQAMADRMGVEANPAGGEFPLFLLDATVQLADIDLHDGCGQACYCLAARKNLCFTTAAQGSGFFTLSCFDLSA